MNLRTVAALLLSLAGVAIPVAFLLLHYGIEGRVLATNLSATQFVELLGSIVAGFVSGLGAAALMKSTTPNLGQVIRSALKEFSRDDKATI